MLNIPVISGVFLFLFSLPIPHFLLVLSVTPVFLGDSIFITTEVLGSDRLQLRKRGGDFVQVDYQTMYEIELPLECEKYVQVMISGWEFCDGIPSVVEDFVVSKVDPKVVTHVYVCVGINSLRGDLSRMPERWEVEAERFAIKGSFLSLIGRCGKLFPNAIVVYLGTSTLKKQPIGRGFPNSCSEEILKCRRSLIFWFLIRVRKLANAVKKVSPGGYILGFPFVYANCFEKIDHGVINDAYGHLKPTFLRKFVEQLNVRLHGEWKLMTN